MDPKARRLFSSVLSPLTLAVSGAGAATYLVAGQWWVLPLTAAVAAVVSATQYATREPGPPLPAAAQARERSLLELIERIEARLAEASDAIRGALPDLPRQLDRMRAELPRLLERQAKLDAFLEGDAQRSAQREVQRLSASLASARTQEARDKFSAALQNKEAELQSREALRATSERLAAELAEMESALGTTLTKLVSLETLQGEEVRMGGAGITGALEEVLHTAGALEEALAETQVEGRQRLR